MMLFPNRQCLNAPFILLAWPACVPGHNAKAIKSEVDVYALRENPTLGKVPMQQQLG
jgi:hypothetical protein